LVLGLSRIHLMRAAISPLPRAYTKRQYAAAVV
jgi:hypothetical protein